MNPWLILGVVLAIGAAAGGGYVKGHAAGSAAIKQQWDAERAQQLADYAKAQEAARAKEQQLQAQADKLREDSQREIQAIHARADTLARSLRQRPERPAQGSAVSSAASACSGASGAQLARGDGEFLAGYAADAARLEAALNTCLAQYEAVRGQ